MRRALLAAFAAFFVYAPAALAALPRATSDRPDDTPGAHVHFVYAVPSDQADRSLDTDGTIDGSIAGLQSWLKGQTGGPGIRIDNFQGQPDITFVRLPQTDAAYSNVDQLYRDLAGTDVGRTGKLLAVYLEGSLSSGDARFAVCGLGGVAQPPLAVVYLHDSCGFNLDASRAGAFGTLEWTAIHESIHGMGFVPSCVPHYSGDGHVTDDPNDLMSPFLEDGVIPVLDANHDDYFHANIPGCLDLSNSRFLEGAGIELTVNDSGQGGGTGQVTGTGDVPEAEPIACTATCVKSYDGGQTVHVQLQAHANPGSVFVGWQGPCTGKGLCQATLTQSAAVTAVFAKPVPVSVAVIGSGRVTSTPAGLSCPTHCTANFAPGTAVTLHAVPRTGWRFAGWSGAPCGTHLACTVKPSAAAKLRATFKKR